MRRASQKHSTHRSTTPVTPAVGRGRTAVADRKFSDSAASTGAASASEGLLASTAATTFARGPALDSDTRSERGRQLAIAIRQRIESRLQGRVRNLSVKVYGQRVVLEGQCATYYSKQLAQHCAIGVLEDEQLENAILVGVAR